MKKISKDYFNRVGYDQLYTIPHIATDLPDPDLEAGMNYRIIILFDSPFSEIINLHKQ